MLHTCRACSLLLWRRAGDEAYFSKKWLITALPNSTNESYSFVLASPSASFATLGVLGVLVIILEALGDIFR